MKPPVAVPLPTRSSAARSNPCSARERSRILHWMKLCSRCGLQKPESDFYKDKRRADGLYPQCRSCASESKKASRRRASPEQQQRSRKTIDRWRREHPDRVAEINRRVDLKRKFGITLEQFDEMLEAQGGVCAICGSTPYNGYRLAVDHDHDTGRVRGLLCASCNRGLGYLADDPVRLRRALEYLTACS